jgi:hypothetical protein
VPDKRRHRGPDPEDEKLFAPRAWPSLRLATSDLCWLLNRGYAVPSAVELVGNRYALTRRQRLAVGRCACADEAWQRRQEHLVEPRVLPGQELWLDGYNVLIAIEAALGGAVVLRGCDECYRDMATIYARYREVDETLPALRLIGEMMAHWEVRQCRWWLDRPVSNSGRFKQAILDAAAAAGWDWQVDLVFNPDQVLSTSDQVVATSDSVILDRCGRWVNLARLVIEHGIPQARVVDLSREACAAQQII